VRVCTAEEMRRIDSEMIRGLGLNSLLLMERAGLAVARVAARRCPVGTEVVVVCGKGNNGGDGAVAARHLAAWGYRPQVLLTADPADCSPDARYNLRLLEGWGVPVGPASRLPAILSREGSSPGLVIDALLGTGFRGEVRGPVAAAIQTINQSGLPVVAVDVPSGVDADAGAADLAVEAEVTVTLGLPKFGLFCYPGAARAGKVVVADLSIPPSLQDLASGELLSPRLVRQWVPQRPAEGHKGTFGYVLVVAGSPGYTGAAALTALGAARSGAGVVLLAVPEAVHQVVETLVPEVVTRALPCDRDGRLAPEALGAIMELAARCRSVAAGPGLGVTEGTAQLVRQLVQRCPLPLVLDADGLNALAGDLGPLGRAKVPIILTPHPGEMGRLLGVSASQVQADRPAAARRLAEETGAVVVCKGAHSLVAEGDGLLRVGLTAHPALATAGSGDVLTGAIAGLLAQGVRPAQAAGLGVALHGWAGEMVAARRGTAGVLAGELADWLPVARKRLLEGDAPVPDCGLEVV